MKKTVIIVVGLLLCAAAVTVIGQKKVLSPKEERREVREKRRAERIANYEKFMDSLVLSRNFQFNPTTFQRQPAAQVFIEIRQYPDVHFVDERPIAKVVVERADFQLIAVIAGHGVRPGTNRQAGKIVH